MKKLIFFLIPLILLGCGESGESEERDILNDVTGVWSEESITQGTTVFEINFFDSLKTLRYIYTPSDLDRKYDDSVDVDYLYDVSIKNIEKRNNIVSFYLTKKGENFKEPLRENHPIWTIRQHFKGRKTFTISLTTHKGKNYALGWVRDY
tara:strand:- start:136 stop:585 length:450 start_codon:yes stop_codon:yes gene_type:complete